MLIVFMVAIVTIVIIVIIRIIILITIILVIKVKCSNALAGARSDVHGASACQSLCYRTLNSKPLNPQYLNAKP